MVPAPEGPGCVAVMAGELFAEIRGLELYLGLGDALDAEIFDKDVRSQQHEAPHAVVNPGVDQRDRGTVAVADENRRFQVELGEEFGESFEGFVVHEGDGARFCEQIGVAGAVARVDHYRKSRGGCDARRETLPVGDRAQTFVEKYKLSGMAPPAMDALHFEAMALDRDFERAHVATPLFVFCSVSLQVSH